MWCLFARDNVRGTITCEAFFVVELLARVCKFDAIVALPDGKQPANKQSFWRAQLCSRWISVCCGVLCEPLDKSDLFAGCYFFENFQRASVFGRSASRAERFFSRSRINLAIQVGGSKVKWS